MVEKNRVWLTRPLLYGLLFALAISIIAVGRFYMDDLSTEYGLTSPIELEVDTVVSGPSRTSHGLAAYDIEHSVEPASDGITENGLIAWEEEYTSGTYRHDGYEMPQGIPALNNVCAVCNDLLVHINLMHGNGIDDSQLLQMAGAKPGTDEAGELHPDYAVRIALAQVSPDIYQALKHYEQNVAGTLMPKDGLLKLIKSSNFFL